MSEFVSGTIAMALVEKHAGGCEYANEYGEPGYELTNDARGILFANWNDVPECISNALERRGYDLEWSDEWLVDYSSGATAYRCQPDSYGWKPSFIIYDGEIMGADDLRTEEREWYIDEYLANDATRADCLDLDLSDDGFEKIDADESGWHVGQDGDPVKMLAAARAIDERATYVFQIGGVGQFDIAFSLWRRDAENEFHSTEIEDATRGYLVCALWTGTDEDGEPLDANYSTDEISAESKSRAHAIVRDFMIDNESLYNEALETEYDAERFGHDLWLTRNGHGAGFWDRLELDRISDVDVTLTIGDALTIEAKVLGEANVDVINGEIEVTA